MHTILVIDDSTKLGRAASLALALCGMDLDTSIMGLRSGALGYDDFLECAYVEIPLSRFEPWSNDTACYEHALATRRVELSGHIPPKRAMEYG